MKIVAFLCPCCPYLQLRSYLKAKPDYVTEKCTTETHFGKFFLIQCSITFCCCFTCQYIIV